MKAKPLRVGKVTIGGKRPAFILGPCVIESEKFVWRMAKKIAEICRAEDVDFIFKASYDKANRTSVRSFRGIGVREGCEILSAIGRDLRIPVTTDVHLPVEADIAGEKIDMLQIPAFLCRQSDLLRAAAETGRALNVKKGQFLAPWDVRNIADKALRSDITTSWPICDRFTGFARPDTARFLMRRILFNGLAGQGPPLRETAFSRRHWRGPRWPWDATASLWRCTKTLRAPCQMGRIRFR